MGAISSKSPALEGEYDRIPMLPQKRSFVSSDFAVFCPVFAQWACLFLVLAQAW